VSNVPPLRRASCIIGRIQASHQALVGMRATLADVDKVSGGSLHLADVGKLAPDAVQH
jgi:hypothetical protein